MTTISVSATSSWIVVPRRVAVSVTACTRRCGVKVRAWSIHTPTTEVGATTRTGEGSPAGACARSAATADRIWTVFPRPMSSAKIPPIPPDKRAVSHAWPCRWYGRRTELRDGTGGTPSSAELSRSGATRVLHASLRLTWSDALANRSTTPTCIGVSLNPSPSHPARVRASSSNVAKERIRWPSRRTHVPSTST